MSTNLKKHFKSIQDDSENQFDYAINARMFEQRSNFQVQQQQVRVSSLRKEIIDENIAFEWLEKREKCSKEKFSAMDELCMQFLISTNAKHKNILFREDKK